MGSVSTETACWLIAAVLFLVGLLLLTLGLCRVSAGSAAVDESRSRVWDEELGRWIRLPYGAKPGPGQLTEAEVRTLDQFQLVLDDLVTGPQWDAGCTRLFDAVRDHRTNTPEGDQK